MTGWIVLGCILFFILFIGSLRARITIAYSDELSLSVRVLFLKIGILPSREKKAGPHSMSAAKAKKLREKAAKKEAKKREAAKLKQQKKAEKKAQKEAEKATKPKKSMSEILDMVHMITEIVGIVVKRFFKHLRIEVARLKIKVATGDAASTAIAYGALTQSLNILLPLLESVRTLKLPDVTELDVTPDFVAESPEADVKIVFSIRVWHIFHILFGALRKLLKNLFRMTFKKLSK
ncbi:MAG: DUF2953 domain-containing protein [Clostridia bacterium]|nr:DUF2953 domain-containing protein [Clostridia bacterium]